MKYAYLIIFLIIFSTVSYGLTAREFRCEVLENSFVLNDENREVLESYNDDGNRCELKSTGVDDNDDDELIIYINGKITGNNARLGKVVINSIEVENENDIILGSDGNAIGNEKVIWFDRDFDESINRNINDDTLKIGDDDFIEFDFDSRIIDDGDTEADLENEPFFEVTFPDYTNTYDLSNGILSNSYDTARNKTLNGNVTIHMTYTVYDERDDVDEVESGVIILRIIGHNHIFEKVEYDIGNDEKIHAYLREKGTLLIPAFELHNGDIKTLRRIRAEKEDFNMFSAGNNNEDEISYIATINSEKFHVIYHKYKQDVNLDGNDIAEDILIHLDGDLDLSSTINRKDVKANDDVCRISEPLSGATSFSDGDNTCNAEIYDLDTDDDLTAEYLIFQLENDDLPDFTEMFNDGSENIPRYEIDISVHKLYITINESSNIFAGSAGHLLRDCIFKFTEDYDTDENILVATRDDIRICPLFEEFDDDDFEEGRYVFSKKGDRNYNQNKRITYAFTHPIDESIPNIRFRAERYSSSDSSRPNNEDGSETDINFVRDAINNLEIDYNDTGRKGIDRNIKLFFEYTVDVLDRKLLNELKREFCNDDAYGFDTDNNGRLNNDEQEVCEEHFENYLRISDTADITFELCDGDCSSRNSGGSGGSSGRPSGGSTSKGSPGGGGGGNKEIDDTNKEIVKEIEEKIEEPKNLITETLGLLSGAINIIVKSLFSFAFSIKDILNL